MTIGRLGRRVAEYAPCHYDNSRLTFRGPARRLDAPYVAVIGGTATFGRFVSRPFSDRLEADLGITVVNLGCPNAGPDVFLRDEVFVNIASGAALTVVQLVGAQNLSNRFYNVHPRRNDRFVWATDLLRAMYPELDFAHFNFTRHLVAKLAEVSEKRFDLVRRDLQERWVAQSKALLSKISTPKLLVHLRDAEADPLGGEALFVTPEMIEVLGEDGTHHLEVTIAADAEDTHLEDLVVTPEDAAAARRTPGAAAHDAIAAALAPEVRKLL